MQKHNTIKIHLIYNMFLVLILLVLIWRCKFGMGWNDEGFYLALVHRISTGEVPVFHEWWVAQTFAPFLVPIYSLFIKLQGTNEGAYLFFRIMFVVINYIIAILIYHMMQKYERNANVGFFMSFIFMIYAKDNILTESYYSLALQSMVLVLLIFYYLSHNIKIRNYKINTLCFIAGILFAIATAANPFICFMYIGSIFVFLGLSYRSQISYYPIICYLIGTMTTGLAYMSIIINRVSIRNFISNLKYILDNSSHPNDTMLIALVKGVWYTVKPLGMNFEQPIEHMKLYMLFPIIIYLIVLLVTFLYYLRFIKIDEVYKRVIIVILLIFFANYAINSNYVLGGLFAGVTLIALPLFLLTPNKDNRIFFGWYIPGILLAFCFQLASDTGFNAMTVGYTISAIASIPIIQLFFADKMHKISNRIFIVIFITILFVPTFYLRIFSVFRDAPLKDLNHKIERGSWAGIYTTEKNYDQVNAIIDALEKINSISDESEHTLITEMCPWGYTYLKTHVGAPTVWRNPFDSPILMTYYEKFPEKIPDYILVLDEEFGYHNRDNRLSGYFYNEIRNSTYKSIDTECGVLYYK